MINPYRAVSYGYNNEVVIHHSKWANIENTTLTFTRKSVTQTLYSILLHLFNISRRGKSAKTKNGLVLT